MDAEVAKQAAGRAATEFVEDGMTLGLGTGSTVRWFVLALRDLLADGLRLRGVATSRATEELAAEVGVPLVELDSHGVDLAVDGADVVDPQLRLVKGGGGAHVREKIVAAAARRFVVVVDADKVKPHLGGALPVELVPFGARATLHALSQLGAPFELRRGGDGDVARSDNGNLLADGRFGSIERPEELAERIDAVPGVVGHGLFLGMADLVLCADGPADIRRLEAAVPG